MSASELKAILGELVDDLASLRANQDVLAAVVKNNPSHAALVDIKVAADDEAKSYFSSIKKRIERLTL